MPLATHSYILLVLLAVVFGLTFASSFSFTPIILVRLVDLDDFTVAYGLILLVQGVGSLIGPPLAGFIYEYTNRWDDTFYAAGISISISGILAYVIGTLRADEETDDEEEDDECTSNE
jgi:MFS family permease